MTAAARGGPPNASGRPNRVGPDGQPAAVAARGLFWGNRGPLLDRTGRPVRHSRGRNWIVCELDFHGRHRTQWRPGRLTELYFLDEATALAAGHRPCGECRHTPYLAFKRSWGLAHPGDPPAAAAIDAHLHHDRLVSPGVHRSYRQDLGSLPDGAVVRIDRRPWLVLGPDLLGWTFSGYTDRRTRPDTAVEVMTPSATVATLAAGYRPVLHPTALGPGRPAEVRGPGGRRPGCVPS